MAFLFKLNQMSTPRTKPQPKPENQKKSEEQLHYESLSNYLKSIVGISGTIIAFIVSVGVWFSYNNQKDMKDDYEHTIDRIQNQVADASNKAIESQKQLTESANKQIALLQESSYIKLNQINSETKALALNKTQHNVDSIFKTNELQSIIEKQATGEIKKKVNVIVDNETKNILPIDNAASSMTSGNRIGMDRLRSYFIKSVNSVDSARAKSLYDLIRNDY